MAVIGMACRSKASSTSKPSPSPSATVSPSPSLSPSDPVSPTPAVTRLPNSAASPELAARTLYEAWEGGDRTKARTVATDTAVDKLFKTSFFSLDFAGCDANGERFACNYTQETERITMTVGGSSSAGFVVEDVSFAKA
jgi:hypothetical protein